MFKYRERMLDYVIRWSVLPRLHPQSVASHSFYVALYTDQLTDILRWPKPRRWEAVNFALRHDMTEVVTGDIMGPVKRMVTNANQLKNFEAQVNQALGAYYTQAEPDWQVRAVVKCANVIDEYFWLSLEVSLGNRSVEEMHGVAEVRLAKALKKIKLETLLQVLTAEYANMSKGLGFPQEDSDVE